MACGCMKTPISPGRPCVALDVEHVKAFASRQVDRARPAYGRVREDRKRRSIEWGTTNNKEYLLSPDRQSLRFWPPETGKIDLDALNRDRLQLLGEAATYEAAGESVVLDEELWPAATEAQEARRAKDPWEDILVDMPSSVPIFRKRDENDDNESTEPEEIAIIHVEAGLEKVKSKDLLEHVLRIPPSRQKTADTMRLANVMNALGWKRNPNGKVWFAHEQARGYWRELEDKPM